jgi:hypothetical protein
MFFYSLDWVKWVWALYSSSGRARARVRMLVQFRYGKTGLVNINSMRSGQSVQIGLFHGLDLDKWVWALYSNSGRPRARVWMLVQFRYGKTGLVIINSMWSGQSVRIGLFYSLDLDKWVWALYSNLSRPWARARMLVQFGCGQTGLVNIKSL